MLHNKSKKRFEKRQAWAQRQEEEEEVHEWLCETLDGTTTINLMVTF
jgi:hypothetical protein